MDCEKDSGVTVTLPAFEAAYDFETKGEAQEAFRKEVAKAAAAEREKLKKSCNDRDCSDGKRCRIYISEENFESLDKKLYFKYDDDDGDFAWGYPKVDAGKEINTGCKCVPKKKKKKK
jgi:hypothetical protein